MLYKPHKSWVKIEDAQAKQFSCFSSLKFIMYQLVASGTFGNAGGIDVWVNGVAAPKLGAPHTRKSGVIMTPDLYAQM